MVNKTEGDDVFSTDISLDNIDIGLDIPEESVTKTGGDTIENQVIDSISNTDGGTMFPSPSTDIENESVGTIGTDSSVEDVLNQDSSLVTNQDIDIEEGNNNISNQNIQNIQNIQKDSEGEVLKSDTDNDNFDLSAIGTAINTIEVNQEKDEGELVDFSYERKKRKPIQTYNYVKWSSLLNSLIFLLLIVAVLLGGYYVYTKYALKQDASNKQKSYVESMRGLRQKANDYISIDRTLKYKDGSVKLENGGLEKILGASDIGYIDKKYLLQDKIVNFMGTLKAVKDTLEDNRKNVTKYAYLPRELTNVLGEDNTINSIEYSLLALEEIKFSSAVSVFRYLDSFTKNFSKSANISTNTIQKNMEKIRERGGKDISIYLEKCYLNPFETNYDCNIIGDYNRYKRIRDNDSDIDEGFFKKMMYYIDLKLERTEFPSFNIVFQKFDKNSDKITFNIEINTQKEDELTLTRAGILEDPVMFILEKLINNLKRSKFIRGNEISIPSVKINTKTIKIGITELILNTISRSFELPIQKDAEREIYDFVELGT